MNPYRRLPAVRWAVQGAYLAFLLLVGLEFSTWVGQVVAGGPVTASRPPSVEAFLPIAALMSLKRLLATGLWDVFHPAGLTILLAAIVGAVAARKAFCAWICPIGTLCRLVDAVANRLLWRRRWPPMPRWLDSTLIPLKHLLLGFFAFAVLLMPVIAIESWMRAPYNAAADAKMLQLFSSPSTTTLVVLAALLGLSLLARHFWCRYLCPYGALLGLFSLFSPAYVRRTAKTCNDCRACTRACPVELPVHARVRVLSTECIGCLSCIAACPVKDTLGLCREGPRALPAWLVPAAVLAVMLGAYLLAVAMGSWETQMPLEYLRRAYRASGIG